MNVASQESTTTPFVASIGFDNLMWTKPTFSTQFHLSFGTLLSSENRASSGTIQTVDRPLEIKVCTFFKSWLRFYWMLQEKTQWEITLG